MNEKQVLRAIAKDFKISKNKVKRSIHTEAKTTSFILRLSRLMEVGGPADIVYILGYKSKKLVQVNIDWGAGVTKNFDPGDVVYAANLLRNHFGKRRYKKDGFLINANLKNGTVVLCRGKDKKDRMVFLRLKNPKTKESEDKKDAGKNLTLKLSYMLDPNNPDMFKAKTK
jgi:hypothetical protein